MYCLQMNWLSEMFDRVGRDLNRNTRSQGANAAATGIVSLRNGNHSCVPEWVFEHAARIRVVDATHNRLTELPPDRWRLFTLLSKLHIAHNQLSMLPASLCLATLTILNLEHNRLTRLPEELGNLRKLRRLEVHHNPLTELPASVGDLACLEFLGASHCELRCDETRDCSGIAALGRCQALVEVHLEHNAIGCIPDALAGLRSLKRLFLDHNPLRTVSSAVLTGCEQLHTLSLVNTRVVAEEIHAVEGYAAFDARRQSKHSKQIAGNVMIGSKGFDDGLDHVMS